MACQLKKINTYSENIKECQSKLITKRVYQKYSKINKHLNARDTCQVAALV